MDSFWTAPDNLPFLISLGLFFGLSLLQGISFLLGLSLDQSVDQWVGVGDADFDTDLDMDVADGVSGGAGGIWGALDWLNAGRIPMLFLALTFLGSYAVLGYLIQLILVKITGGLGSVWIMGLVALPVSLPISRWSSVLLGKVLPKDETSAVSRESFIGQAAIITLGVASVGAPAQAKLKDLYGQTHYVMVEPDEDQDTFSAGDKVILVRFSKTGSGFLATADPFNSDN